jgi:hypothetical protein
MSKHFRPIFNEGIMENGVIIIDGAKIQAFIDNFLTPIVTKYNLLSKDERRELLVEADTDSELIEELLDNENEALVNGNLSVGYLLVFLHNNYNGLNLDEIYKLLFGEEYRPISQTGTKRGRILFKKNNSNNNNGIHGPPSAKRSTVGRVLNFTTGGSKKRNQKRKSRTMKKRK